MVGVEREQVIASVNNNLEYVKTKASNLTKKAINITSVQMNTYSQNAYMRLYFQQRLDLIIASEYLHMDYIKQLTDMRDELQDQQTDPKIEEFCDMFFKQSDIFVKSENYMSEAIKHLEDSLREVKTMELKAKYTSAVTKQKLSADVENALKLANLKLTNFKEKLCKMNAYRTRVDIRQSIFINYYQTKIEQGIPIFEQFCEYLDITMKLLREQTLTEEQLQDMNHSFLRNVFLNKLSLMSIEFIDDFMNRQSDIPESSESSGGSNGGSNGGSSGGNMKGDDEDFDSSSNDEESEDKDDNEDMEESEREEFLDDNEGEDEEDIYEYVDEEEAYFHSFESPETVEQFGDQLAEGINRNNSLITYANKIDDNTDTLIKQWENYNRNDNIMDNLNLTAVAVKNLLENYQTRNAFINEYRNTGLTLIETIEELQQEYEFYIDCMKQLYRIVVPLRITINKLRNEFKQLVQSE